MLLAYFDESGDSGRDKGSATYTLGGVLIDARSWPDAFDRVVEFRRELRGTYDIRLRDEIKANYLIRGSGDLAQYDLDPPARREIWERHFQMVEGLGCVRAYGVVIDKEAMFKWRNPRDVAWEYALQRLERVTTQEDTEAMVIHDEGDDLAIRKIFRRRRRLNTPGSAFGTGALGNMPIRRIVDDPVPRNSKESYFLQLADMVAYAAFRTCKAPGKGPAKVCPQDMWGKLGEARWSEANGLATNRLHRTDEPGVVVWPK